MSVDIQRYFNFYIIRTFRDTCFSVKEEFLLPTHSIGGYNAYTLYRDNSVCCLKIYFVHFTSQ